MALSPPLPGQVIRYAYLWWNQAREGREDATKDRPCGVVLTRVDKSGDTIAYILPITHTPPLNDEDGIEIPAATKQRLRLDSQRSWIITTELNQFIWPGPDLKEMCVLDAKRELSDYFRKEFHAEAFVDMQPISSAARSDEVPSAFYFWVRASTEDAKQYRAGTARVVLRVDSKCDVTGFISKADILASRARLADFFPADLIPKILWFAETPQK